MSILIVVNRPSHWPLAIPGIEVVAARQYLSDPVYHTMAGTRVFNLCRSYSYQSVGYYVSLLAEARDQKPEPDVGTIQDMKSVSLVRAIAEDLEDLITSTLRSIRGESFTLSIYFGRTLAKRDEQLGRKLFGRFRCPLLRAEFVKRHGAWQFRNIWPIPASEIPENHHDFVVDAAKGYFSRRAYASRSSPQPRHYLAILHDPKEETPPSNEAALNKFEKAAHRLAVATERITKDDYARLSEFDALFIRTTTFMNHYTYRFARRAAADGLAVIDDPLSIARCTNKVYLAEAMKQHHVPIPETTIILSDTVKKVAEELSYPVVLKQPDSAFSLGVSKANSAEEFLAKAEELLEDSEMILAQPFVPSEYDWRIGVLDHKPLYACKYFMAKNHWQIVNWKAGEAPQEGKAATIPVEETPPQVLKAALKAARLIGDGLYGVDLKMIGDKVYVIEVNDNPNLDARWEDRVLKDELYNTVIRSFVERIERLRRGGQVHG